jgi:hypothetical protein
MTDQAMTGKGLSTLGTLAAAAVILGGVALGLVVASGARATDYDCADFSSQAAAQSFYLGHGGPASDPYHLDADGDGVACESNPCPCTTGEGSTGGGGAGGGASKPPKHHCRRPAHDLRVRLSKRAYPNIISHIKYSWHIGYPKRLVIWRKRADQRRDQLLNGIPTKSGFDRDEAPAAVLRKKVAADVRYVPSSENRSAGASLGSQISGYCNGVRVRYRFTR